MVTRVYLGAAPMPKQFILQTQGHSPNRIVHLHKQSPYSPW